MDWRNISRSRSRVPMDWKSSSRSRSRAPGSKMFDEPGNFHFPEEDAAVKIEETQFQFPSLEGSSVTTSGTSPTLPIGIGGRRSPTYSLPMHSDLHTVYESGAERLHDFVPPPNARFSQPSPYVGSLPNFPNHLAHPSSLPSYGFHGMPRMPVKIEPSAHAFPRHVRKTSFDHTVAREGTFSGIVGRHQVDGRPRSPDSMVGIKRPADAPHAESMLRGDLPDMSIDTSVATVDHQAAAERQSPFPSSSFNFSFPSSLDNFSYGLAITGEASPQTDFSSMLPTPEDGRPGAILAHALPYSPLGGSPRIANDGLSVSAASAAIGDAYASLGSVEDYQIMQLVYPYGGEGAGGSTSSVPPFTHVDPTQILPMDALDRAVARTFHPSPGSDGWNPSVSSSATASPEPYTSNGSTPPSAEGHASASVSRNPSRKVAPARDVPGGARVAPRKKSTPTVSLGGPGPAGDLRSSTSTPDYATPRSGGAGQAASGSSKGEDEAPPTVCTNCQTTNTPLWRRDPAGQPLCEYRSCFSECARCCGADDDVRMRGQVTRADCSTCVFFAASRA
jgi:hypothetical protein